MFIIHIASWIVRPTSLKLSWFLSCEISVTQVPEVQNRSQNHRKARGVYNWRTNSENRLFDTFKLPLNIGYTSYIDIVIYQIFFNATDRQCLHWRRLALMFWGSIQLNLNRLFNRIFNRVFSTTGCPTLLIKTLLKTLFNWHRPLFTKWVVFHLSQHVTSGYPLFRNLTCLVRWHRVGEWANGPLHVGRARVA